MQIDSDAVRKYQAVVDQFIDWQDVITHPQAYQRYYNNKPVVWRDKVPSSIGMCRYSYEGRGLNMRLHINGVPVRTKGKSLSDLVLVAIKKVPVTHTGRMLTYIDGQRLPTQFFTPDSIQR